MALQSDRTLLAMFNAWLDEGRLDRGDNAVRLILASGFSIIESCQFKLD